MEFRDLKRQYQALKPQLDAAMQAVAGGCDFISGQQVKELERQLAAYVGTTHCITCANGTDALTLVLLAWGIKPGDAVFVPDFTFFATGEAVAVVGATPVFVDVDADSYNMNPACLEAAVQKVLDAGKLTPRAVIPVDLFGLPAAFDAIGPIAKKYGLLVLEDGAQGFGGSLRGQRACSLGDAATTSFFPAKPLGCYGDGGAVFTDDDEIAGKLRSLCAHGTGGAEYDHVRLGMNSRLDTLQAAILQVKLAAFQEYELAAANRAAAWYTRRLQGAVKTPVVPAGYASGWAQYTIQLENRAQRDAVQTKLWAQGIPGRVYYPKPMHLQPAFASLYEGGSCPVTERLCETVLSLPMHPYLTAGEMEAVVELLLAAHKNACTGTSSLDLADD